MIQNKFLKIKAKVHIWLILLTFISFIFSCKLKQNTEIQSVKIENIEKKVRSNEKNNGLKLIPLKVLEIREYVVKYNEPKKGYIGGRKFKNLENILPKKDENGEKIFYKEWDVNPIKKGRNRGKERLVTGTDGKAYFTKDHYKSFQLININ